MKCPNCKKELKEVNVFSNCWQKATVENDKIVEYGGVEEVLETLAIECRNCQEELPMEIMYEGL